MFRTPILRLLTAPQAPENSLDILDVTQPAAAEIPIPVLGDFDGSESSISPAPRRSDSTLTTPTARKPSSNLPTISVTKPPAPLPVELPTPHDLTSLPSPPDSTHSSFEDIESGRSSRNQGEPPSRQSGHPLRQDSEASEGVPEAPLLPATPPQSMARMSPPIEIPDLMSDSTPLDEPLVETEPDNGTGIRLVGGGGVAGVLSDEPEEESTPEPESNSTAETPEVTEKKHKKTKSSIASLGKVLGGKKKKDTASEAADSN